VIGVGKAQVAEVAVRHPDHPRQLATRRRRLLRERRRRWDCPAASRYRAASRSSSARCSAATAVMAQESIMGSP
jgi:hypothetical protein